MLCSPSSGVVLWSLALLFLPRFPSELLVPSGRMLHKARDAQPPRGPATMGVVHGANRLTGKPRLSASEVAAPGVAAEPATTVAPTTLPNSAATRRLLIPRSPALVFQLEHQAKHRCDYVLVKPRPDDAAAPPLVCPVKLHHQAFLQLAFRAMRDRCVDDPTPCNVVPLHQFLTRYLDAIASWSSRKQAELASSSAATPSRKAVPLRVGATTEQRTLVVPAPTRPPPVRPPSVRPLANARELRDQLLLEYGVDALDVNTLRLARDAGGAPELREEEFFAQMGRPSDLAQQCSIQ